MKETIKNHDENMLGNANAISLTPCIPKEAAVLLGKAFFLDYSFSLNPTNLQGTVYFFYVSGCASTLWRKFVEQLCLNMTDKTKFFQPVASLRRPVCIAQRNYYDVNTNTDQSNDPGHILGLLYFSKTIDCLNEQEVKKRINRALLKLHNLSGKRGFSIIVKKSNTGAATQISPSVKDFIINAAHGKQQYLFPYDPTDLKFRKSDKAAIYYSSKFDELVQKIHDSPQNYI